MPQKATPRIRRRIAELAAQGWTVRQIADEVGLGVATVQRHKPDPTAAPQPSRARVESSAPPEPSPPLPEEPGEPLTSGELQGFVSEQVRRQRDEAARCAALGDTVGQQRAAKAMATFATMAQRMLPRADEAGVVRVRPEDMAAAAQQTRDDLQRLLARELERGAAASESPFGQTSPAQAWIRRLCSFASSTRSGT